MILCRISSGAGIFRSQGSPKCRQRFSRPGRRPRGAGSPARAVRRWKLRRAARWWRRGTQSICQWERYGDASARVVEVGNIFAIELGVSVPGRDSIGREENVVVTENGTEYLSHPQWELWVV